MYTVTVNKDFVDWLTAELGNREWSNSTLARRAEVVPSTVSMVLSGQSKPGLDFCVGVARAFGTSPESVLRRAGLLPSLPPAIEEEQEIVGILRRLTPGVRETVVTQLRALSGQQPAYTTGGEPGVEYELPMMTDDELERDLLEEFRRLPPEWQQEAIREVERLHRLKVRFIGEEEVEEESETTPNGQRHEA